MSPVCRHSSVFSTEVLHEPGCLLTKKQGDRKMWWKRRWWISVLEFFVFSFQASDFRHCGLRDQGSPDAAVPSFRFCEVGGTIFSSLLRGGGEEGGEGRVGGEWRGEAWWSPQFSLHPMHMWFNSRTSPAWLISYGGWCASCLGFLWGHAPHGESKTWGLCPSACLYFPPRLVY